jgi:hypothetical protein
MVGEELDSVRASASALLVELRNQGPAAAARLKPRPADIAKVFRAELVELAITHYAAVWSQPIELTALPDQNELVVYAARAEELPAPTFPGGYRQVAAQLVAGRTWIAWKYIASGARRGMAYDGLVWIDDHFAWFPKPWRMVAKTTEDPFFVD